MRHILATAFALSSTVSAGAQVNTVITDGDQPFAEGVLVGYEVQVDGRTICSDPVAHGRYISCSGQSLTRVWVESNGVLGAYIVVDPEGRQVCEDPAVWNQFRGQMSFIVCQ